MLWLTECCTIYIDWESRDAAVEVAQGKAVADAARAAGVSLFIWSSLPNVTKFSNGELTTVHHFDSKAKVEEYIRTLSFPSSVFIMTAFFMQNISSPIVAPPKVVSSSSSPYLHIRNKVLFDSEAIILT